MPFYHTETRIAVWIPLKILARDASLIGKVVVESGSAKVRLSLVIEDPSHAQTRLFRATPKALSGVHESQVRYFPILAPWGDLVARLQANDITRVEGNDRFCIVAVTDGGPADKLTGGKLLTRIGCMVVAPLSHSIGLGAVDEDEDAHTVLWNLKGARMEPVQVKPLIAVPLDAPGVLHSELVEWLLL